MGIKSKKKTSIPHSCPTMRRIMKLGTLMSVVLVSNFMQRMSFLRMKLFQYQ